MTPFLQLVRSVCLPVLSDSFSVLFSRRNGGDLSSGHLVLADSFSAKKKNAVHFLHETAAKTSDTANGNLLLFFFHPAGAGEL